VNEPDNTALLEREIADLMAGEIEEPRPEFAAELGQRVRDGFPRRRRVPRLPRLTGRRLAVAGGLASALVAVAITVSVVRENGRVVEAVDFGQESRDAAPGVAAPEPVPPSDGGGFTPGREQRIERSASLTLAAPADELDAVADRIVAVADRHRGFVLRSSVTSGDESAGGNFELRIPVGDLRPALRELSALGDVRSRSQSGQDVTRQFADARERLDAARAERKSLLRRLERADSDSEAAALRQRLGLVAGEIRAVRAGLRDLRLRTDYVAVSVALERSDDGDGGSGGGAFAGTGDAFRDSLDTLAAVLNTGVRALGLLLPVGLLTGGALLGARALRRRRREAVLS